MTKNRDDFEELCESIVEIVSMLQEKISRHGVEATSSLQQFCQELEGCASERTIHVYFNYLTCLSLLQEIQYKLGEIQAKPKKGLGHRLKQFATSASIGDELAKYKIRLKRLRSNFIVSVSLPMDLRSSPLFQAVLYGPAQHQWYAHSCYI
jgi:hypothetical protein